MPSTKPNCPSSPPPTTTPDKSAIKHLPAKLAKKVKRQFRRLDGIIHHVIHPKERRTPTFSITSPSSPLFYPVGVVRAFLPPDQSSTSGSVDTWNPKKEDDMHSISSLANHSIDSSTTPTTDMSDDDDQILHEQDPSPTVIPDPFLVDSEDDSEADSPSSKEEAVEENSTPSDDANSQQVASPTTEAVPLNLPSSPVVNTPRPPALLPNLEKDVPPPPSEYEEEEEYVPELYVPALIVPTMFLPIPNVRPSFSSNHLTWWLSRNSLYNNNNYNICTRPIL